MASFFFILVLLYSLRIYFDGRFSSKKLALTRIGVLTIVFLGIFLVLNPEITNRIANKIGIGRGADLLFYSAILAGLLLTVHQIRINQDLKKKLLLLNREIAVLESDKQKAD